MSSEGKTGSKEEVISVGFGTLSQDVLVGPKANKKIYLKMVN